VDLCYQKQATKGIDANIPNTAKLIQQGPVCHGALTAGIVAVSPYQDTRDLERDGVVR
jgi:hypothetical protein